MARDDDGITPLHKATMLGTSATIQTLLAAGADIMAQDKTGKTPLHDAANCLVCRPGTIQTLLAAGAHAKTKDVYGKTSWDYAQKHDFLAGSKGYWALNEARYD
jgi:ankyrin repeat protein